jgi:2,6-dihydroxypseudooxynicotine hydrolase
MSRDALVQAAIDHWAPRFLANGVYYVDFQRTTERTERWEQWCAEWSRTGEDHAQLGDDAQQLGAARTASDSWRDAAICYHFGKFLFVQAPAEMRRAHMRAVELFQRAAPGFDPPAERLAVPYEGKQLWGYLRRPRSAAGSERPPVAVIIPGLDSTKEELHYYEGPFLERGFATFSFDGPGQGEAEYELPIEPAYEKAVDAVCAVLQGRSDLDASWVAVAGVSFGGYYAARAAARSEGIRAAVAICTFFDLAGCFDRLTPLSQRAFAHRSGAGTLEAARERARALSLEGVAEHTRVPLLVIHGRLDRLIAPEEGERLHAAAGALSTLWMFEDGNHVCANIPYKWRPQLADWLKRRHHDDLEKGGR